MFSPVRNYKERVNERLSNLTVKHLKESEIKKGLLDHIGELINNQKETDLLDADIIGVYLTPNQIKIEGVDYKPKRSIVIGEFFYGSNTEPEELLSDDFKDVRDELLRKLKRKAVSWFNRADLLLLPFQPFSTLRCSSCRTPGITIEGVVCRRS